MNQHLSRAEALGDDLHAVAGTSLDKGVELDALKTLPAPERKQLIERARAGEKVSARRTVKNSCQRDNYYPHSTIHKIVLRRGIMST